MCMLDALAAARECRTQQMFETCDVSGPCRMGFEYLILSCLGRECRDPEACAHSGNQPCRKEQANPPSVVQNDAKINEPRMPQVHL